MLETGYIKLHRKLTKWGWYHDANTFRVFIHLLLTSNFESAEFEGKTIRRGQRVTSVSMLSRELKVSVRSIRTALTHLKLTGEVTIETTPKYSIISIKNYDFYQQATSPLTNDRQTTDKRPTNDRQQYKKDKKDKKDKKARSETPTRTPHGEFRNVLLSDHELAELKKRYPQHYGAKIERLSRYLESTGKTYENHYSTLLMWLEKDTTQEGPTPNNSSYDINELDKIDTLDWME